jgi:hypothetical protein
MMLASCGECLAYSPFDSLLRWVGSRTDPTNYRRSVDQVCQGQLTGTWICNDSGILTSLSELASLAIVSSPQTLAGAGNDVLDF